MFSLIIHHNPYTIRIEPTKSKEIDQGRFCISQVLSVETIAGWKIKDLKSYVIDESKLYDVIAKMLKKEKATFSGAISEYSGVIIKKSKQKRGEK